MAETSVRAHLYDAPGEDRAIDILRDPPRRLRDHQLLWIDVAGRDRQALEAVAGVAGLSPSTVEALADPHDRPLLLRHDTYLHVALSSVAADGDGTVKVTGLDLVAAPNIVITVRGGPVEAFERFRTEMAGVTQLGRLDTATVTASLVDAILASYLELVEDLERRVDALDDAALRARGPVEHLEELAALRRRAAVLRRALAPHRHAFAALARPDIGMHELLGRPWPGLLDRLDTTLAAIESARDLLLGTYDLLMTRAAQRTNDTMKLLTVISAVLLPASLVASVMGMNFDLPLFQDAANFWWVVAAMAVLMVATLAVARTRDGA
jgi:Mg2+ and Co2+ transporter CorA